MKVVRSNAGTGGVVVGIDLGTTNSMVAVVQGGTPRVVPNALGEDLTPSAVSVLGQEIVTGAAARARSTTHPGSTALSFKRDMGTDRIIRLGPRRLRPQELSAMLLRTLREEAEAALGVEVTEAVVTVPAYFDEAQRQATKEAAHLAGLKVERLLNEPTAAAIAYGLHERDREVQAVVLDLGGGTFDVTALEILEGVIEIQGTSGDTQLGGDDFSRTLALHVRERLAREQGAEVPEKGIPWARLLEACEGAKHRLSREAETPLALPQLQLTSGGYVDAELTVTRDEAEAVWQPLLERMRRPILRALHDAGRRASDPQEVVLVGGATRMPCFQRFTAQLFGRMPLRTLPPDHAVALGAAVQAGLKAGDESLEDVIVTDIAPFSLGIAVASSVGGQSVTGLYSVILERGTVLPTSRIHTYSTAADRQNRILVEVFQGEHSMAADNRKLGELLVRNIPPAPAGCEAVSVRFTYDLNALLEVEATVESTGQKSWLLLESTPGRLSADELDAAQAALQSLKFHPRDALPNTTALARAEALFVELTGVERQELAQAIASFRAALDSQDQEWIAAARNGLLDLIQRWR